MSIRVAIVGVGPVGERIYQCLKERGFPLAEEPVVMTRFELVGSVTL